MNKFSEWLKEQMDINSLSIYRLSKEIYIDRHTISQHLKGIRKPYRSTLRAYALYFDIDYWDLYEMTMEDTNS